jgi:hypothetical protein
VTGLAALLLTLAALATEAKGQLIGADRHGVVGWVASKAYAPYIIWLGTVSGIVGGPVPGRRREPSCLPSLGPQGRLAMLAPRGRRRSQPPAPAAAG